MSTPHGTPMGPPDMSNVDPGLQPTLIALLYLFPGLALAVLIVRFWKRHRDHNLGGDDVVIALAWMLALANSIITHFFVKAMYTGYRAKDVPFYAIDLKYAFKFQYALSVVYNPCICLVKASFLWTLYKLNSFNPWINRSIIGLQALNGVYMISTTIVSIVPCIPIAKMWDGDLPGGCYDPSLYVAGNVSVVIITDFLVLLIPSWIIWDLRISVKRKIIAIAFLSLGVIVIAIGLARLFWLLDAFKGKVDSYSVTSAYSAIESSVAIIGASGPTVKYILGCCIPWLRSTFEGSDANKRASNPYGGAYASNSNSNGTRHLRKGMSSGYDDLDSVSVGRQNFEMKSDRTRSTDGLSDEQKITSREDTQGIVKSVEWTVHSREDTTLGDTRTHRDVGDQTPGGRPATKPTDIV